MDTCSELSLSLRHITACDEALLLAWRNLPWIAALGANQRTVTPEEHHTWFTESLRRKQRCILVAAISGTPVGMIRYDLTGVTTAEVSIYLMPEHVGRGIGTRLFAASLPLLMAWHPVNRVVARILRPNARSLRYFQRLGFIVSDAASSADVIEATKELEPIRHSRPCVSDAEAAAAAAVVLSGQLARGPVCQQLEARWCSETSMPLAATVGSGLAALRLALLALGIGPGDEVIVPAYSCVALLNPILALGARPVLADVLLDDWTLSPIDAAARLTARTKAIVAVHLFGAPAKLTPINSLGIPVIEDCAHGIGGQVDGHPFGSKGSINIGSFYATKMIAAGEGGIVASSSGEIIRRVREASDYSDRPPDPRYLNDKMTDVEAAIALEQLRRLPQMLRARAERAAFYHSHLRSLAAAGLLRLPAPTDGRIWYRYPVRLLQHDAAAITRRMSELGVQAEQPVWDFRPSEYWSDGLEVADIAFKQLLSLPLYPDLSLLEQERVCHTLSYVIKGM